LSLAQILEAGTWKAGRELAEVSRPNTKEPPIGLLGSDGTVKLFPFIFHDRRLMIGILNRVFFGDFWRSQEDRYLHFE
jgi:Protein of unknown function (DUF1688)